MRKRSLLSRWPTYLNYVNRKAFVNLGMLTVFAGKWAVLLRFMDVPKSNL